MAQLQSVGEKPALTSVPEPVKQEAAQDRPEADSAAGKVLATRLKDSGNAAFRAAIAGDRAGFSQAEDFYAKALDVMDFDDPLLESIIHSNLAAVYLQLGDNEQAVRASYAAIEADPKNAKAQLRGARASRALGLLVQAARFCHRGLVLAPDNPELLQLQAALIAEHHTSRCS